MRQSPQAQQLTALHEQMNGSPSVKGPAALQALHETSPRPVTQRGPSPGASARPVQRQGKPDSGEIQIQSEPGGGEFLAPDLTHATRQPGLPQAADVSQAGRTQVVQRQVLSNVETADGEAADPYHFYVIDVVIGGRSPSPFSNTMGAHSTAWVAHIDAVRRTVIRRDIRDALEALIALANEDLESSELLTLVDNLQDQGHKQKLLLAKQGLQQQIDRNDVLLTELSDTFQKPEALSPQQKQQGITAIKTLIDTYLTYVNYLPGATVRGGDPSGHGEGSARGNLNLFEYVYASQQAGVADLPEKVAALGSKGFEGHVKACSALKFQAGDALNELKQALVLELWTMFAVETPGIFADFNKTETAATWTLLLKNFLKTAAMAYPYTYTVAQMNEPAVQLAGLFKALAEAGMNPSLETQEALKNSLLGIGKTPVNAAPRGDYTEVAESDLKRGGTGFKATILLASDGTVGSVEMIGRTQSPFKGTMGAHTTAWIAHLDALRNLLANKTPGNAITALKGKCVHLIDDATLAIFTHVDEQQQEFIILGISNTKRANALADTFAQNTVQLHEQVAFLEAYIFQYLSLLNFLPLSTIQTAAVPGGRAEGRHRQFLQSFEENPVDAPSRELQDSLVLHLRGLYDPTAIQSFPPSKLGREALVFHGDDEEQRRSEEIYKDIELAHGSRKYDKSRAHSLIKRRFIETISEAYPKSCKAIQNHPSVSGNLYDLIN